MEEPAKKRTRTEDNIKTGGQLAGKVQGRRTTGGQGPGKADNWRAKTENIQIKAGVPLARQLPHVGFPRSPCPPVGPGVFLHCSPASCPTWASQQTPANSFLYSPCYVVCRAVKAGCHQDPLRSSVAKRSSVWNEELMALCRQQAWELGGTTVSATWMEFPAFGPWAGAPMLQLASFSQPYRLLLSFDLRAFLLVIVQRWAVAKNPCFLWCIPAPEAIRVCQRALGFGQRFVRFKAVSAQLCFWFKASKKKLRWSW